jgi:hypothetical protein
MTNNEQEEYRLAALAAGISIYAIDQESVHIGPSYAVSEWRPKTDKADSFDLMAACRMDLFLSSGSVRASNGELVSGIYQSDKPIDEQAMEVIFMRAVSIGRSIEQARIATEGDQK